MDASAGLEAHITVVARDHEFFFKGWISNFAKDSLHLPVSPQAKENQ